MQKENNIEKIYVGTNELAKMLSVGRNTALKIGLVSGAKVKVGRRSLYNVEKVKEYMANL